MSRIDLSRASAAEIRSMCRAGTLDRPTPGVALGFTQVNLVVLPANFAGGFEEFCRLNPRPCPLLEVNGPGQYSPIQMAPGADVRFDLPRYRVLRNGRCVDRPPSIEAYWRDDCVAFLIGCSFTFESALLDAGLPIRHIEEGVNVPMYRSNLSCEAAGAFDAPLVVSMRPMTEEQAEQASRITAEFPRVHGRPIHVGDPAAIGIGDLTKPDYGDPVTVRDNEVPVFWACGVTPMEAIIRAGPDLAITHEPGHMLITDVRNESLREVSHRR